MTFFFPTFAGYIHEYYKYNILGSLPTASILESTWTNDHDGGRDKVYGSAPARKKGQEISQSIPWRRSMMQYNKYSGHQKVPIFYFFLEQRVCFTR